MTQLLVIDAASVRLSAQTGDPLALQQVSLHIAAGERIAVDPVKAGLAGAQPAAPQ